MIYFYSHGFHSGRDCATFHRISEGLKIKPYELVYENGGDFLQNLISLKSQLLQILGNRKDEFAFIGNSLGAFYLWQLCAFARRLKVPTPARLAHKA